jgi:hypothetical protein
MEEMSKFLVFNSEKESQPNNPRIDFSFDAAICTEMNFLATPLSSENHNA